MLIETFNIFSSKQNYVLVTKRYLKHFKIKIPSQEIEQRVLSQPNQHSILSIHDTLISFGFNSSVLKLEENELLEVGAPSIVQIETEYSGKIFVCIEEINIVRAIFYNHKDKKVIMSTDTFFKLWTGIALVTDGYHSNEFSNPVRSTTQKFNYFLVASFLVSIIISLFSFINQQAEHSLILNLFTIKLIGLITGIFLLWFEIDNYNPIIKNICSLGKRVNCNAVLNSKEAKLFGGLLSWSEIGFSYFMGTLLFLVFNPQNTTLTILASLSYLGAPFILYSIYYQAIKIKQFCVLCLITQLLLISEITVNLFYRQGITIFEWMLLPKLIGWILLPLICWKVIYPLLQIGKTHYAGVRNLNRFKSNPHVFVGLLKNEQQITYPTEGLGIELGSKNAKYKIVKICNPYCGPCAEAHQVLEKLLKNGKIHLQIIFMSSIDIADRRLNPVQHLMTLYQQNNQEMIIKALDDWYNAEIKDYEAFAKKYPVNENLADQNEAIETMYDWSKKEGIEFTPTLFINGYKVPSSYSLQDLQNIMKESI